MKGVDLEWSPLNGQHCYHGFTQKIMEQKWGFYINHIPCKLALKNARVVIIGAIMERLIPENQIIQFVNSVTVNSVTNKM